MVGTTFVNIASHHSFKLLINQTRY